MLSPLLIQKITNIHKRLENIIDIEKPEYILIAYSGGKDSTFLLHMVLEFMLKNKSKYPDLKLMIIYNDTLVENPIITEHVYTTLDRVKKFCKENNIQLDIKIILPELRYRYWVNLIGKGYPLPNINFRWCQDKLKIKPTGKFIKDIIKKLRCVFFVGLRLDESLTRQKSINNRMINDIGKLNDDKSYPKYAPIYDITEDEVWEFLILSKPLYEDSYKRIIDIYKEARGECPLIPDKNNNIRNTACGMRFGCWVCTLVKEDKTLKNQIKNISDKYPYLMDLYNFRKFLIDVNNNPKYRSGFKRNGKYIGNGKGVLKISARILLLQNLLSLQNKIPFNLISLDELNLIYNIWEEDYKNFGNKIY